MVYEKVQNLTTQQERNEVRWRPGQEASLAPLCSNLSFFGSKCTVLKKVLVTFLVLFGTLGIVPPLPSHRYAPATQRTSFWWPMFEKNTKVNSPFQTSVVARVWCLSCNSNWKVQTKANSSFTNSDGASGPKSYEHLRNSLRSFCLVSNVHWSIHYFLHWTKITSSNFAKLNHQSVSCTCWHDECRFFWTTRVQYRRLVIWV